MPTYITLAKWTDQGIRNIKDTVTRTEQVRAAAEKARRPAARGLVDSGRLRCRHRLGVAGRRVGQRRVADAGHGRPCPHRDDAGLHTGGDAADHPEAALSQRSGTTAVASTAGPPWAPSSITRTVTWAGVAVRCRASRNSL